ncbi:hypothetical protein [Nocardia sp. NPDC050412]|uniref:hypothetical protein n=1 Tax=Nocardia sp. NPDC050412 TaxID=3364320 RepID=UPI0037AA1E4B
MPVAMVAAAILVALIPIATNLPALAALGLLRAVLVVLIATGALEYLLTSIDVSPAAGAPGRNPR